jgi:catechol 2,3-dioxygenase-like lactoylglutathione lyase family enzyme
VWNNGRAALKWMDNVGIVVESLDAAIAFFVELGLELEGRATIEGENGQGALRDCATNASR